MVTGQARCFSIVMDREHPRPMPCLTIASVSARTIKMGSLFQPHGPCERGTNENTNGLLRQFFSKGTRFTQLSRAEIKRVQAIFNDRPGKALNRHSPAHAFHHLLR